MRKSRKNVGKRKTRKDLFTLTQRDWILWYIFFPNLFVKDVGWSLEGRWLVENSETRRKSKVLRKYLQICSNRVYIVHKGWIFFVHFFKRRREVLWLESVGRNLEKTSVGRSIEKYWNDVYFFASFVQKDVIKEVCSSSSVGGSLEKFSVGEIIEKTRNDVHYFSRIFFEKRSEGQLKVVGMWDFQKDVGRRKYLRKYRKVFFSFAFCFKDFGRSSRDRR